MEKVERIISQKGFYFICTKVLYPDFIGPKYIIVTDDANISINHSADSPETQRTVSTPSDS